MDLITLYALVGFILASYSVIANDSVQTLGTFIASNSQKFKWYYLAGAASLVLCGTLAYGWTMNGGDITFGRLNKIPYIEPQWYHALAPAILLLLTNLYGPLDNFNPKTSHVIASLIKKFLEAKIKNKKQVVVWGNGKATRDFCYVEDITEGLIQTAEKYNSTEPLNLGSGKQVSIKKIAKIIKKLIDYKGSIKWDPNKPVGPKKRFLSIKNAKKKIGFRAKTSIENGLKKTINWYLNENLKY